MRTVVAECSVIYAGRGNTTLDRAQRAIILKEDGSVGIHNDVGNKAINYMGKGNIHTISENEEGESVWRFDARKEYIEITLHHTLADINIPLDDGSVPLVRDGTEHDLQAWLFENPHVLGEGVVSIEREFGTTAGAIDLLCKKDDGSLLGVEVKRVAMLGAIDQCLRYQNAMREEHGEEVTVILAALDVRPNTVKLAEKRKISYVTLPADWNDVETDNEVVVETVDTAPVKTV